MKLSIFLIILILVQIIPVSNAETLPPSVSNVLTFKGKQTETYTLSGQAQNFISNFSSNFSDVNTTIKYNLGGKLLLSDPITQTSSYVLTIFFNTTHYIQASFYYEKRDALFLFPYFDLLFSLSDSEEPGNICSFSTSHQFGWELPSIQSPYRGNQIYPIPQLSISWDPYIVGNFSSFTLSPATTATYSVSDNYVDLTSKCPSTYWQQPFINETDINANPSITIQQFDSTFNTHKISYGLSNVSLARNLTTNPFCPISADNIQIPQHCQSSLDTSCDGFIPLLGNSPVSQTTGVNLAGFLKFIGGVGFCIGSTLIQPIFQFTLTLLQSIKDLFLTIFPGLSPLINIVTFPITGTIDLAKLLFTIYIQSGSRYGPGGVYWSLLIYSIDWGCVIAALTGNLTYIWKAPLAFLKASTVGVAILLYWIYYKIPVLVIEQIHQLIMDYRG